MSTLDDVLAVAANNLPTIAALSPESAALIGFSYSILRELHNWRDNSGFPIPDTDIPQIYALIDQLETEIMTPLIGYIFPYLTTNPPPNCLPCDGSSYLRVDYPDLYAALDTAFVVDADHFITPDLRGRSVIGAGTGTGLTARAVGSTGGEESHVLTTGEIPGHTHSTGNSFTGLAVAPGELTVLTPNPLPAQTGSTGGDGAHNNMPPFLALKYGVIAR